MINSLLVTKLYMPSPRSDSIKRLRLSARLDEGIAPGRRVTLVSAPAGYGKTTAITGWLYGTDRPYAWISLDEDDNDPARFFKYMLVALKSVHCETGQVLEGMLRYSDLPPVEVLVTMLINDIASAKNPFILVLDDYHVIRNSFIHKAIQKVLDYLPPVMNLVLVTREDPPLSFAKWRITGQLSEIRAGDLRFTSDEAEAFFLRKGNLKLTGEEIAVLLDRTEGWVAGLHLAAISLQRWESKGRGSFIEGFNGSHRYVIGYLMEEVLRQQDSDVRAFLCQTAILDRFCPSLCDVVTGRSDSKAMLTKLEQTNLFLIPQDDYRVWFRYHHLFAGFLRTELAETERKELHRRAALWYEANDNPEDAVKHALAAGDAQEARSVILRVADTILERGQARTLLGWIEALPGELVLNDAEIISLKTGALFMTSRVDEATELLSNAKNIPSSGISVTNRGWLLSLEVYRDIIRDDKETLKPAEEALNLIGDNNPLLRIFALNNLGRAQRVTGNIAVSSRTFREAFALAQKTDSCMHALTALGELVFNLYIQGNLREAIDLCHQTLRTDNETNCKLLLYAGILYIPLGIFFYEINKLDLSRDYLIKGLEAGKRLGLNRIISVVAERALARVLFVTGKKEAAFSLLRDGRSDINRSVFPLEALKYDAQEADFKLKEGDLNGAARWVEEAGLSPDDRLTSQREQCYHVYARILIAQERYNDAWLVLNNLERFARERERYGSLITVLILQSLVRLELSGLQDAVPYVEEAVELAAPGGYFRTFLDEGPDIALLLWEVCHLSPIFVSDLLKAFNYYKSDKKTLSPGQSNALPENFPEAGLIEPLSKRELEIVRLIAVGLSNAGIARELHITVGTVKWHANNIYSKLNVQTRTQAAAKVRELGLLD